MFQRQEYWLISGLSGQNIMKLQCALYLTDTMGAVADFFVHLGTTKANSKHSIDISSPFKFVQLIIYLESSFCPPDECTSSLHSPPTPEGNILQLLNAPLLAAWWTSGQHCGLKIYYSPFKFKCCNLVLTFDTCFVVYFAKSTPGEIRAVVMTAPTIVYPQQATIVQQDGRPLEQAR